MKTRSLLSLFILLAICSMAGASFAQQTGTPMGQGVTRQGPSLTDSSSATVFAAQENKPLVIPTPQGSGDWPQFGHDAERTGYNPGESVLNSGNVQNLQELWHKPVCRPQGKCPANSPFYSTAATFAGSVFVGSLDGNLYGFDPSGVPLDYFPIPVSTQPISSTPAVNETCIFAGAGDDLIYAMNTSTGNPCWPTQGYGDFNIGFYSPMLTNTQSNGAALIMGNKETTFVLDPATGNSVDINAGVCCDDGSTSFTPSFSPAFSPDTFDTVLEEGHSTGPFPLGGGGAEVRVGLFGYRLTGNPNGGAGGFLCGYDLQGLHCGLQSTAAIASLQISGNTQQYLYTGALLPGGSLQSGLSGSDLTDGLGSWHDSSPNGYIDAAPAVDYANDVLFVIVDFKICPTCTTYETDLFALKASTGAIQWRARLAGGHKYSAPAVANGVVYAVSGRFVNAYPENCSGECSRLWQGNVQVRSFSQPVISNGHLYVVSSDGVLHAFGL